MPSAKELEERRIAALKSAQVFADVEEVAVTAQVLSMEDGEIPPNAPLDPESFRVSTRHGHFFCKPRTHEIGSYIADVVNAYADGSLIHRDEVPDDPRVAALAEAARNCLNCRFNYRATATRCAGCFNAPLCAALDALGGDER